MVPEEGPRCRRGTGAAGLPFLVRFSHTVSSRDAGDARGYEARDGSRPKAYLNSTSRTATERNEVDMGIS